jgi:hypothetical protein
MHKALRRIDSLSKGVLRLRIQAIAAILATLSFATPAFADGIFADDAHQDCRNAGKGTTEANLRACCRERILAGGLFGPNDPSTKKEVNKCVALGTGGPLRAQNGLVSGAQKQDNGATDPAQEKKAEEKKDCPTDGAGSAIGGALGGTLGSIAGSAVDKAKCE